MKKAAETVNVADYIQAFQAEGILDSEGSFTVSLSQARAKLRHFRSSDDSRFLLHLVAASHGAGAERISVTRSPSRVHLSAPGAHFTEDALIAAYTNFFRLQHQTPASELVMGAVMAQALEAEELSLLCRRDGPSFRWCLEKVEECSEEVSGGAPLFELEVRFGSVLSAWLVGLLSGETSWRDCQWLEDFCSLSRVPISINGRSLNRPVILTGSPVVLCRGANLRVEAQGARVVEESEEGYAAALAPGSGPLYLVVRGVQYPGPKVNLVGVVYCDRLRLDLTLEQLVQDSIYNDLVEELKRRFDDLLCACDLEQAGPEWARPYMSRLVQLAVQGRIGIQGSTLLADWLQEEAPNEIDQAYDELSLLSDVVRFYESEGSLASHREIPQRAYSRARRLVSEARRSLELVDRCAWLAAAHGHSSAPSWRLLGAALALEKSREGACQRLREQLASAIPRSARLFLLLGLWALEAGVGDFREGARLRRELLRGVEDLPDEMARREFTGLLKERPEVVCVYAASKLCHFASYDPEVRAALAGGRRP